MLPSSPIAQSATTTIKKRAKRASRLAVTSRRTVLFFFSAQPPWFLHLYLFVFSWKRLTLFCTVLLYQNLWFLSVLDKLTFSTKIVVAFPTKVDFRQILLTFHPHKLTLYWNCWLLRGGATLGALPTLHLRTTLSVGLIRGHHSTNLI